MYGGNREVDEVTVGSLFSGIGGFDLGLERAGMEILWQVEIDPFCNKVLEKHWPNVRRYKDVKEVHGIAAHTECDGCDNSVKGIIRQDKQSTTTGEDVTETVRYNPPTAHPYCDGFIKYSEPKKTESFWGTETPIMSSSTQTSRCPFCLPPVDLICGGFPCQPFSCAGKRKGKGDDRHLWPEMLRVISEVRPRWIIGENVAGIINMELDHCISDLEGEGYEVQTFVIPACSVNAPHRRDRVWIVANSCNDTDRTDRWQIRKEEGVQGVNGETLGSRMFSGTSQDVADTTEQGLEREITEGKLSGGQQGRFTECNWWSTEPELGRVAHGIPNRVDRLKSLGNTVVPQIVEILGRAIMEVENMANSADAVQQRAVDKVEQI